MNEESAIQGVAEALKTLNRALTCLPAFGISASVDSIDIASIAEKESRHIITIHLTRTKTEIDVQL